MKALCLCAAGLGCLPCRVTTCDVINWRISCGQKYYKQNQNKPCFLYSSLKNWQHDAWSAWKPGSGFVCKVLSILQSIAFWQESSELFIIWKLHKIYCLSLLTFYSFYIFYSGKELDSFYINISNGTYLTNYVLSPLIKLIK